MSNWQTKSNVTNCRFEQPRGGIESSLFEICQLSISTLYLERIQTYRGHCVLIFDPRHVTRIDELTETEWQQQAKDIRDTEIAIMKAFSPDHINIASIGQMVPHLHWHIIPRYQDDPRWGKPIWMTTPQEQMEMWLSEAEYIDRAEKIREAL